MQKVKTTVGISGRHVHLSKETYDKLFDHELTIKYNLNQIGQFAANETVKIKTKDYEFSNVRVIGPLRSYDQVEISMSDARKLGLNPPVRKSGDLEGAEEITIATEKGKVTISACIIADRHIHVDLLTAKNLGINTGDAFMVEIPGIKKGMIEAIARVSDDGYFEVHLDTDDANAFLLKSNDEVNIIIDK